MEFRIMLDCLQKLTGALRLGYKIPTSGPGAVTESNIDIVMPNIVRLLTTDEEGNPMKSDSVPPVLSDVEMAADLRSHQRAAFGAALRRVEREVKRAVTGHEMTDAEVRAAIDQLAQCG